MTNESPDHEADAAPLTFKTLVRFGNVTYRIGRLSHGEYEVVRILDDVRIGTFGCFPQLTVMSSSIHPAFILKIARAAARASRPSWIRRLAHALRGKRVSEIRSRVGPVAPTASDGEESHGGESHGGQGEREEEIVTLQKPEEKG
jgi:ribosomal protein L12E/L44/L45/RPP1/RPP2